MFAICKILCCQSGTGRCGVFFSWEPPPSPHPLFLSFLPSFLPSFLILLHVTKCMRIRVTNDIHIHTCTCTCTCEKDDLAQTGNDQNQTGLCRSNTFNSGFQTSQQHSGVSRSSFHLEPIPISIRLSPSTDTVRSLTHVHILVFGQSPGLPRWRKVNLLSSNCDPQASPPEYVFTFFLYKFVLYKSICMPVPILYKIIQRVFFFSLE